MNNTSELYMTSKSGYAMPFDDRGEQVEVLLPFGEQKHPDTGQKFFHHGIDLKAHYFVLSALADGVVTGVGNDARHGLFVVATYDDKYVVTYGHLSSVHVMFGQKLQAGMAVGVSGKERLHLGVRYKEEEIDPLEFITMLYANVRSWNTNSEQGTPEFVSFDMDVHTDYDQDKEEIEQLMMRYYPAYMEELLQGSYRGTEHIIQSLRNLFTVGSMKQYFMETLPSIANPMGVTRRAVPLVSKAQNLLISDFLNYLAIRQQVFLSSMGDPQKKLEEEGFASQGYIDPLADLEIDVQSFDIPREVSVYADQGGINWWTKAWFNNRADGEAAVAISQRQALAFWRDEVEKDEWLEEHFPKPMEAYHHAIEQTKEQLTQQMREQQLQLNL